MFLTHLHCLWSAFARLLLFCGCILCWSAAVCNAHDPPSTRAVNMLLPSSLWMFSSHLHCLRSAFACLCCLSCFVSICCYLRCTWFALMACHCLVVSWVCILPFKRLPVPAKACLHLPPVFVKQEWMTCKGWSCLILPKFLNRCDSALRCLLALKPLLRVYFILLTHDPAHRPSLKMHAFLQQISF